MARKNGNINSDLSDPLAFETYVIKSTRASKVPVKVQDPTVLRMVAGLLDTGKKPSPTKAKATRKVRDVQLPEPQEQPAPPAPVDQRLQKLEGQMGEILSLLRDQKQ